VSVSVIIGSHVIVLSTAPEADRRFFADVLGQPHVDAGGGCLAGWPQTWQDQSPSSSEPAKASAPAPP
jgi:hypothetical protein